MLYICNSFSLAMLPAWRLTNVEVPSTLVVQPVVDPVDALEMAELHGHKVMSAVGHADTAAVLSSVLERNVTCHRMTVTMEPGDILLVGQLTGPRLAEGATTLPVGAVINWLMVSIAD